MLRMMSSFVIAVTCFCSLVVSAPARDLKISLPFIPPLVESKDKGILIDLCKAMVEEYKDGKITWDVYPFARSLDNVAKGRADIHMPYTVPKNPQRMSFQYSTDTMFRVVVGLYTNKGNKEINLANLTKYKIETDEGCKYIMDSVLPNVTGSPSIESSLQKVDIGRIDGWIFPMSESDGVLKKLGLKNIKRWEYGKFDVKALFPPGETGKETDKIFSDLIRKLKASGKYQKIMAPVLAQKFDNWQP